MCKKTKKFNCITIKLIESLPFWDFWDALSMDSFRLTFLISVFSNFCRLTLATGWCKSTTRSWKIRTNFKMFKNSWNFNVIKNNFLTFFCRFLNRNMFSNLNHDFSNKLYLRNAQEQVKKAFCFKNWFNLSLFEYLNCSSDLKFCNFSAFSLTFQNFFFTVDQNNFWHKITNFMLKLPGDQAIA